MSRFQITDTPLPGLKIVQRQLLGDSRGFLSRLFCQEDLAPAGWSKPVAQINHTYTAKCGTIRGLHYQTPPHTEMKLVQCIRGEIWDVAVDIRQGSSTFLQWYGEHLSAGNCKALLIPEGFAHGFQTLSDDVEMIYCHTAPFTAAADAGLPPTDPRLNIAWPLKITELSARDLRHPPIDQRFRGIQP